MRLNRIHWPAGRTAQRDDARKAPRWQVVALGTAATFAVGYFGTVVVRDTTTTASATAAKPAASKPAVPAELGTGTVAPAVQPFLNKALLKEVPVGPGKVAAPVRSVLTSAKVITTLSSDGIPAVALSAYQHAATSVAATDASCHLPWQLVAAIGRVESDDGRFGGSQLESNGNTTIPIYGIPLNGQANVALIRNTTSAEAALDGGTAIARAVGPMQFIPSTWESWGADGNGDGVKDPNNIFDAALAAGHYLCAGGGNLTLTAQAAAAVRSYNDADQYVRVVLALEASYEQGQFATVPAGTVTPASGGTTAPPAAAPAPAKTPAASTAPAPGPVPPSPAPPAPASPAPPAPPVTAAPSAPAPTAAPSSPAATAPAPTAQPSYRQPHPVPRTRTRHGVDEGWAPAMRQVVVKILTTPARAPASPAPAPASPSPSACPSAAAPARQTPAPCPSSSASPAA